MPNSQELVFGVESCPVWFDPARWWHAVSWDASCAVFDRLVAIGDDYRLQPQLLSELPTVDQTRCRYTMQLRKGVLFHHGRELEAADVKFSLERVVDPATQSEARPIYSSLGILGTSDLLNERSRELSGIRVVDRHTLTVELEQPDSTFLWVLGLPFASIVPRDVVQQQGGEAFNSQPVGSGPFLLENLDPDTGLTLKRSDCYWQAKPAVGRIAWQFGIPPERSVERILAGEQDLMSEDVPAAIVRTSRELLERDGQLVIEPVNNVFYITLSLRHPTLRQRPIRRAIAHAIDKRRLHHMLGDLGAPAEGGLFSPQSPYYQDGLAIRYDPALARRVISESPGADVAEIAFYGTNWTPWKEIAEAICDDLSSVGLTIRPCISERKAFVSAVAGRPDGMLENQWELPYPHGSYLVDGAFAPDSPCNFSHWSSQAFQRLAAQARRTHDEGEQKILYRALDRMVVRDEILWVPILYPATAQLVSRRVRGYRVPRSLHPNIKLFASLSVGAVNGPNALTDTPA